MTLCTKIHGTAKISEEYQCGGESYFRMKPVNYIVIFVIISILTFTACGKSNNTPIPIDTPTPETEIKNDDSPQQIYGAFKSKNWGEKQIHEICSWAPTKIGPYYNVQGDHGWEYKQDSWIGIDRVIICLGLNGVMVRIDSEVASDVETSCTLVPRFEIDENYYMPVKKGSVAVYYEYPMGTPGKKRLPPGWISIRHTEPSWTGDTAWSNAVQHFNYYLNGFCFKSKSTSSTTATQSQASNPPTQTQQQKVITATPVVYGTYETENCTNQRIQNIWSWTLQKYPEFEAKYGAYAPVLKNCLIPADIGREIKLQEDIDAGKVNITLSAPTPVGTAKIIPDQDFSKCNSTEIKRKQQFWTDMIEEYPNLKVEYEKTPPLINCVFPSSVASEIRYERLKKAHEKKEMQKSLKCKGLLRTFNLEDCS